MLDKPRPKSTLRPAPVTTGSARIGYLGCPETDSRAAKAPNSSYHSPRFLMALERVMFHRQFVLIAGDNKCIATVDSLDAARRAIADGRAASAGGRLSRCLLAADIDAELPEIGDACAEPMTAWCERHRLPYLLRDSGRPGGRHFIALVTHRGVPVEEWAQLCRDASERWNGVVTDRTGQVLRLLTARHRLGAAAPVIACTITPRAVRDAQQLFGTREPGTSKRGSKPKSGTKTHRRSADTAAGDRSAEEFGVACAAALRGYTGRAAWNEITTYAPDGHAAERGQTWFRRYMWLEAVTIAAAEQGLSEEAAWDLAQQACPAACRRRGRGWWRGLWDRAIAEAATPRPRRYHLASEEKAATPAADIVKEIAATRRGLADAIEAECADLDPRRRRSTATALYHLASAIVTRDGSMSIRDLAERSRLDPSTVQAVLRTAAERGLLVITGSYHGGSKSCQSYGIGSAAADYVAAAMINSPHTSCSTPRPPHGRADPARLAACFAAARKLWARHSDTLATLAPGERLAASEHPAAKLLRSLWYQQKWWQSLTGQEQEARRARRRAYLGGLHPSERSAWFDWLDRRAEIVAAADRIATHTADPGDMDTALTAPLAIHRGMHARDHLRYGYRHRRRSPGRDRRDSQHPRIAIQHDRNIFPTEKDRVDD
jgi:hypothetical protein